MTQELSRRVVEQYDRFAPEYDARWGGYIDASVEATLTRLNLSSRDRVLDLGCGTGALLTRLLEAPNCPAAAGIDLSARMLEMARPKLPHHVSLTRGDAHLLPYSSAHFDAVISCNMFHFLAEPRRAVAEFRRVLKPRGRLIITDWCDDFFMCKLCDLYLRLFSPDHLRMFGSRDCRQILASCGFDLIRLDRFKINWLWGMMTAVAEPGAGR